MATRSSHVFLLVIFSLCSFGIANAQNYDVEGLEVDSPLTKAQVIKKFGKPDFYNSFEGTYDGIGERFKYGKNSIQIDNNIFVDFAVCDTTWAVCTKIVPGGIKVGMPASFLESTPLGPIKSYTTEDDRHEVIYYVGDSDFRLLFDLDNKNTITGIYFFYPM